MWFLRRLLIFDLRVFLILWVLCLDLSWLRFVLKLIIVVLIVLVSGFVLIIVWCFLSWSFLRLFVSLCWVFLIVCLIFWNCCFWLWMIFGWLCWYLSVVWCGMNRWLLSVLSIEMRLFWVWVGWWWKLSRMFVLRIIRLVLMVWFWFVCCSGW